MSTKLYLHNATSNLSGTFPTTEQSNSASNISPDYTLRTMNTKIGTGMTSVKFNSYNNSNVQHDMISWFTSPPLDGDHLIGTNGIVFNMGSMENENEMNFWVNGLNLYIWDRTLGTKRGTIEGYKFSIKDYSGVSLGSSEKMHGNIYCIYIEDITAAAQIDGKDGDVIIAEIWSTFTQSTAVSFTGELFFDGTTETNIDGQRVYNHASYIQLPENIHFRGIIENESSIYTKINGDLLTLNTKILGTKF